MEKNPSEKLLYLITTLLIVAVFLLSLSFPFRNSFFLFLLAFALIYWQRRRLQSFFQKIKKPKISYAIYILTGWLWAIFLELNLGRLPFNPKPIANLIIGSGFYLPYFAVWLVLIKYYQFSVFEIFYLSGFSKVIFDVLISRKLFRFSFIASNPLSAFLIFIVQAIVVFVIFGVLTTLPAFFFKSQDGQSHNKPLKQYLIGLTPNFLAGGVFILWTIILKIIFT